MTIKTGIGQDSHAFEKKPGKPLILAGVKFDYSYGLKGNSDADVIFHSITNAISSVTGINVLGSVADKLVKQGKKDSSKYLRLALNDLQGWKINHIAISIECLKPKISPQIELMKQQISGICKINIADVGITATSGEGLTAFGRGEGIQAITIITVSKS
jgi:2-C-methyl-D-erythritol 2,4-cyclodiphosphate synthase